MAKPGNQGNLGGPVVDAPVGILDSLGRFLFYAGGIAFLAGVGMLLFTFQATGSQAPEAQVMNNTRIFGQAGLFGAIGLALGVAWLYWDEEISGPLLGLAGAALLFAPSWLPAMQGGQPVTGLALQPAMALQQAGYPLLGMGIVLALVEVIGRIRVRTREGMRADQVKLGKGLKEERDVRNVFMGKCWQLPYCRKFVREQCPIYHSKRTCWKERVGCMCEEKVIANAMQGVVIPKDMVAAAKFIPYNTKLPLKAKQERCRQCVIYNEHQKHKYTLAWPIMSLGLLAIFGAFWNPMANGLYRFATGVNRFVADVTMSGRAPQGFSENLPFHHVLLFAIMIVAFSIGMKVLEHLFFRLKI